MDMIKKLAGDAFGGNKDEDYGNQGYEQGRPEGYPFGGGEYGQEGYGERREGHHHHKHHEEGLPQEGYRPGDYGGQEGGSGPQGFHPQEGAGYGSRPEGYRPQETGGYGGQQDYSGRPEGYRPQESGYGGQQEYGGRPEGYRPQEGGYGGRPEGYRPQESGGYGGQQEYGGRPEGYPGVGGQPGYGERPEGYRPQESGGGYGGRPQQGYGVGQDDDFMSSMGKLVSGYQGASQQSNGDPSFSHFQNELNAQGNSQHLNGGLMDKLSGMFHQETGQQYQGGSMQSNMLAKFISSKLGFDVPPQLLEKLMSWQQAGHF
ncbi:probable translation initiation factor IF-2 [Coccomyxa sp. Obi]|nr:probable translation initiation factor IF-2 [Coccomyxa sp. Obi]